MRRRLFFAAWPSESVVRRLSGAVTTMLGPLPGRAHLEADWHVTLCFLGAVEEALIEPLCRHAAGLEAEAFELTFDALAYWRKPRALVACARPPAVAASALPRGLLANAERLMLSPDRKPWTPHLTLARGVAPHAVGALLADGQLSLPEVAWPVECFDLVESRSAGGRRYQSLCSWPLRARA